MVRKHTCDDFNSFTCIKTFLCSILENVPWVLKKNMFYKYIYIGVYGGGIK